VLFVQKAVLLYFTALLLPTHSWQGTQLCWLQPIMTPQAIPMLHL
jgi:hypothetical protein